jgi:NADH dehydrogenase
VYEFGGPEYLTLRKVMELVLAAAHTTRVLVPTRPPYLRPLSWIIARLLPAPPVSPLWLDHFAVGRTTDLDTLPREFGLQPARFSEKLSHLQHGHWGLELLQSQLRALRKN